MKLNQRPGPRRQLQKLRELAAAKSWQLFAARYGLVYFASPPGDTGSQVFGLSYSGQFADRHYCLGHLQGFDLTVVRRDKPLASGSERWLIMQIDLPNHTHPPLYICSYPHSSRFWAELSARQPHLQKADHLLNSQAHSPMFGRFFRVYSLSTCPPDLSGTLNPAITSTLAYHFRNFGFELAREHLYVYSLNSAPLVLGEMLRVGLWLAGQLKSQAPSPPDPPHSPSI